VRRYSLPHLQRRLFQPPPIFRRSPFDPSPHPPPAQPFELMHQTVHHLSQQFHPPQKAQQL
jgi:hypothetical protein